MSTYIALTVVDAQNEINKQDAAVANYADFTTRFARSCERALADYQEQLAQADDILVRAATFGSAIAIGSEVVNTTDGDVYTVALPADARRVAGNSIMVSKASSAIFVNVPRMTWDSIIASGGSQTPYAFWENNGKLHIYVKDTGAFDNASSVNFNYYRRLDATLSPTSTPLDIHQDDFGNIVSATLAYMKE